MSIKYNYLHNWNKLHIHNFYKNAILWGKGEQGKLESIAYYIDSMEMRMLGIMIGCIASSLE